MPTRPRSAFAPPLHPLAVPARLRRLGAPALIALALALGPARTARAGDEIPTVERIVAVVNSEVILLSELEDRAMQIGGHGLDGIGEARARQLHQLLERMVDDLLVLQQASELKLGASEEEIDRAVDEIKKSNNLDQPRLEAALREQGFTYASYRRDLRRQILRMKVINAAVRSRISTSDEDVKAFYEQTARQSGGNRKARVRHILVSVAGGAAEAAVEERRQAAARIVEELRGGADFEELARRRSDDEPTRDRGGDLGWLGENDGLPEALEAVIFSSDQAGEVRGPVRTPRGFEIVQLLEMKAGDVRPYEEVKDQIRQQLYAQQLERQTQLWLGELRKKSHVDVRL